VGSRAKKSETEGTMTDPLGKDEIKALKGILYILPVIAACFFAYAFYWVNMAETAAGTVVSTNRTQFRTTRGYSTSYSSVVEYTVEDGQTYSSKESWPSTFFKYEIGDEITVYYFPEDPKNIILGYNSSLSEVAVGTLLGWIFLMWLFIFKIKRPR
jgi:hypothetical protein